MNRETLARAKSAERQRNQSWPRCGWQDWNLRVRLSFLGDKVVVIVREIVLVRLVKLVSTGGAAEIYYNFYRIS